MDGDEVAVLEDLVGEGVCTKGSEDEPPTRWMEGSGLERAKIWGGRERGREKEGGGEGE